MKRNATWAGLALCLGLVAGALGDRFLAAQPAGVKRTKLLETELAGLEGRRGTLTAVELAPGGTTGRHYHPGHEIAYVLAGNAVLEREGMPPLEMKPGEAVYLAPRQVHEGKNAGPSEPLRLVVFSIHEKDQPETVPAK